MLKHSLLLMNFKIGKQIFGLISEISGDLDRHYTTGIISSFAHSPKNLFFATQRKYILETFHEFDIQHAFKIYKYKLGYEVEFVHELSNSQIQSTSIKAVHNYNNKKYSEVIQLLKSYTDNNNNFYYKELKYSLEYNSFIKLNLIKDALILFGNIFFDELIITRKLNYIELYKKCSDESVKNSLQSLIDYPILYSLIVKEYDLYEAYDDFMFSMEINHIHVSFPIFRASLN